jgi:hypothetical protein
VVADSSSHHCRETSVSFPRRSKVYEPSPWGGMRRTLGKADFDDGANFPLRLFSAVQCVLSCATKNPTKIVP